MRQQGSHHLPRDPEPAVVGFFRWNHRGTWWPQKSGRDVTLWRQKRLTLKRRFPWKILFVDLGSTYRRIDAYFLSNDTCFCFLGRFFLIVQTTCLIDISTSSIQKEERNHRVCLKLRTFWINSWESKGAGTPKCQKSPALFEGIFFRDLYENHAASAGGQGRGHYHHGCWCRRGGFQKGGGELFAQVNMWWMWEEIPILSSLAEIWGHFAGDSLNRPFPSCSSYPWSCFE